MCFDMGDVMTIRYDFSMASLHRDPRGKSPFFYCAFTHVDGSRAFKSTKKVKRKEASEVARGFQRAVDLARRGDLTETEVHSLKLEICKQADIVLPKQQAFIGELLGEIHERANGDRINFASTALPSQYSSLMRVRVRLVKRNRCPLKGSSLSRCCTAA